MQVPADEFALIKIALGERQQLQALARRREIEAA